jgi:hypothetical protein
MRARPWCHHGIGDSVEVDEPGVIMMTIEVERALARLIDLAKGDTGQSRRAANFLLAWWNGDDWGHFDITDLFGVDLVVSQDMVTILDFLSRHPGAIYADAFGYRPDMETLICRWRSEARAA